MKKYTTIIKTYEEWKNLESVVIKALEKYNEFQVTLQRAQRTKDQNSYLHVVIEAILKYYLDEQGINCDKDGVKVELKETFGLHQLVHLPNGEVKRVLRSTATYDIEEMRSFIERIVMFYEQNFSLDFTPEVRDFINNKETKNEGSNYDKE